jgi:hypothetical protein
MKFCQRRCGLNGPSRGSVTESTFTYQSPDGFHFESVPIGAKGSPVFVIYFWLLRIRPLFGFSPNPRKIFSVVRMSDGNKPLGTLFNGLPLKLGYSKLRNHRVRIGTRGCHKAT